MSGPGPDRLVAFDQVRTPFTRVRGGVFCLVFYGKLRPLKLKLKLYGKNQSGD